MSVRQIDIARKLGVSQQAISAVLTSGGVGHVRVSEELAQRIRDAAHEMGYRPFRPAQQLAGRGSSTIGVLIGAHVARVYYTQLAELERHAFAAHKQLSVGLIRSKEQIAAYLADFRSHGIDTLICMIHELPGDNATIPELVADFDRVIYLNQPTGVVDPAVVEVDFADGARQTVEHLKSRGHQRIGMALFSRYGNAHAERSKAFVKAARRLSSLKPKDMLWVLDECPQAQDLPFKNMMDYMIDHWILPNRLDAIIASNDEWAVHLILRLKRRGVCVPKDIAVAGQDNMDFALACDPEITTLDFCQTKVAQELMGLVTWDPSKPLLSRHISIKPTLIIREST